jgi:glycerol-3-phosphate O-acyltransferase
LPLGVPLLFLLDARNRVEERLLREWLAASPAFQDDQYQRAAARVVISDEPSEVLFEGAEALLAGADETVVVPLRVCWTISGFDQSQGLSLRHLMLGDPRAPGVLRARWILLRDQTRAACINGAPATIADLKRRYSEKVAGEAANGEQGFSRFVLRQAGLALDIAERDIRGSRYKVPRFVAENMHANTRFRQALEQFASESGEPLGEAWKKAGEYMSELISRPRPVFIDLKAWLERYMLSLGYGDSVSVEPAEVERFRSILRNKPTLVLFTHKTYLDGMAATDIAYRNDMPLIHTFGGANMAMPGLSTMMRGAGGIFIRRSFRDNVLYKLVLRFYISYLLEKRFAMTWAFEGTRSRIGKLMPPRFGLLKYVIDAAHKNDIRDLHFLPVSTSFDLIRDVDDYAAEQAGKSKKPESLTWFMGYLRSLKSPKGRIYVNFGEPVVVDRAPDPEDRLALAKIAFEVAVQANRVTPFTLNAVVCLILLGAAPRSMTANELQRSIDFMVTWGRERGIRMAGPLASEDPAEMDQMMKTLLDSGLFTRYDQGSQTVYAVDPSKHATASYYRNTIVHHLLDRAIIDLSLLKAREQFREPSAEVFWEETSRLRDLFKFEFFYPEKPVFRANLEAELDRIDGDWSTKLEQGGPGLQSLISHAQPLVGHTVFLPLVEAYTVVLLILAGLEQGEEIDSKECVARSIKEGRFLYLMRRITSEASIAKVLFENGYQLAENLGLAGVTDEQSLAARKLLLREFRDLSRRMETARLEALKLADKVFADDE